MTKRTLLPLLIALMVSSFPENLAKAESRRSMNDPASIEDSIARVLALHKALKPAACSIRPVLEQNPDLLGAQNPDALQAAPETPPTPAQQIDQAVDGTMKAQWLDRKMDKLTTQIAETKNGYTKLERLGRRMEDIASDVKNTDNELHDMIIGRALFDYINEPESRDAIAELLILSSDKIGHELHAEDPYPYARSISEWTMTTWGALTFWDIAGRKIYAGGKNVWTAMDGWKGVGRGIRATPQAVRNAPAQMNRGFEWLKTTVQQVLSRSSSSQIVVAEAEEGKRFVPMLRKFAQGAKDWFRGMPQTPGNVRGALGSSYSSRVDAAKNRFSALQKAGISLAVGGVVGGISQWNKSAIEPKTDPRDALEVFQAFAIAQLEMDVLSLEQETLDAFSDENFATLLKALRDDQTVVQKKLGSLAEKLEYLKGQYAHFDKFATHYKGNIPLPAILTRVEEIGAPLDPAKSHNRVHTLVKRNKKLVKVIHQTLAELRTLTDLTASEELAVSLDPIDRHLKGIETLIQANTSRLSGFLNLDVRTQDDVMGMEAFE